MSDDDIEAIFDGFEPSEHEAEAKQYWGFVPARLRMPLRREQRHHGPLAFFGERR